MRTHKLPSQAYGWVLFVLLLASLPALIHLPIWVAGIVVAAIAWRFLGKKLGSEVYKGLIGKLVVGALLLAGIAGIYLSFPSWFGGDAIMSFFVMVVMLKWAESHTRRDGLLMIFAAVILSAIGGMYWQNILSLLHMLLVALALVIALLAINDEEGVFSWTQLLGKAGGMFLLALPLMAIMFVTLPRIPGPIWDIGLAFGMPINLSLKNDKKAPSVGKQASGKGISRVNKSDDAILVAEFPNGDMPYKSQLYWRGPVFYDFDGINWTLSDKDTAKAVRSTAVTKKSYDRMIRSKKNPVTYSVRVSAHNSHWLYSLDLPYGAFPETKITEDYQLVSVRAVSHGEFKYEMTGYMGYEVGKSINSEKESRALAFPESSNPQLQQLGKKIGAENQGTEAIMQAALRLYSKSGFSYSEDPELADEKNNLDTFFFDTKNGNSMHLAGSYIALMRAAGVPARLVTGFRGGDLIALTDFIIVRNTHAFAWPEVWFDNKGWVRIEVKDIVVPPQLEMRPQGKKKKQTEAERPKIEADKVKNLDKTEEKNQVMKDIKEKPKKQKKKEESAGLFGWKKWSKGLEKWVLNYNPNRQVELFKGAGIKKVNWAGMAGWAIGALLLFMGAYVGVMRWRYRQMADPLADAWKSFVVKVGKLGVESTANECPSKFQLRIVQTNPDLALGTSEVIQSYLDLRYGNNASNVSNTNDVNSFVRQVKRFVAMT